MDIDPKKYYLWRLIPDDNVYRVSNIASTKAEVQAYCTRCKQIFPNDRIKVTHGGKILYESDAKNFWKL